LLARAGDRTHRSLLDVADTVLHTGGLPAHRTNQADTDSPAGGGTSTGPLAP